MNSIQLTEMSKFNYSDQMMPHGYVMDGVSRQPLMQNKSHQVTFKVCNLCCDIG